jgi:hypothetical protein
VGEFDHRLGVCEPAFHAVLQFGGFAFHFLIDVRDRFSEAIKSVVHSFDRGIEVATRLCVRVCVLLLDGFEQTLDVFIGHGVILR